MRIIVVCVEVEYAHALHKPILAICLEAGYKPDGWLGPLCRSDLLYDLSDEDIRVEQFLKLEEKLCELIPSG